MARNKESILGNHFDPEPGFTLAFHNELLEMAIVRLLEVKRPQKRALVTSALPTQN